MDITSTPQEAKMSEDDNKLDHQPKPEVKTQEPVEERTTHEASVPLFSEKVQRATGETPRMRRTSQANNILLIEIGEFRVEL